MITVRDLLKWGSRDVNDFDQLALEGFTIIAEKLRAKEEKELVKRIIQQVSKQSIDERKWYKDFYAEFMRQQTEQQNQRVLKVVSSLSWTTAFKRMFALSMKAFMQKEAVLLIGVQASGKSSFAIGPDGEPSITWADGAQNYYTWRSASGWSTEFICGMENGWGWRPSLAFDPADGLPTIAGYANYRWIALIPQSATQSPAGLLQHGHGLLGSATQVQGGDRREFANQYNYVTFALDWIGMSNSDTANIIQLLGQGNVQDFVDVSDRLRQGIVNFELGMRMMRTSLANDPEFGQYIDPTRRHYLGISQGGIFGGTYMAISTEIERGVLGVPGQPYNLLLNRSVDFDVYLTLLQLGYTDPRDLQMVLAMTQMLWDHAEPTGYTYRIESDPFPNTPAHQVLIRAAVGDHQVSTLGAHIMARAVGAAHLDTGVREVWGLDPVSGSHDASAYVEYDFGLPMDPIGNVPQEACDDPHGKIGGHPDAMAQVAEFFATGVITNHCPDGVCSFPELSGCP